jgi:hypothetical protein
MTIFDDDFDVFSVSFVFKGLGEYTGPAIVNNDPAMGSGIWKVFEINELKAIGAEQRSGRTFSAAQAAGGDR